MSKPAPTYDGSRTTGFASPAEDHVESVIDLAEAIGLHQPNRYPMRVQGNALRERGILDGDVLIIDTDEKPKHDCVAMATLDGQNVVCQMSYERESWWIRPSPVNASLIRVKDEGDIEIWGVVMALVRQKV